MENNKLHILVVDDDDRIRNLLKDYLSDNNYIVSTAENADGAKEKIEYIKLNLIFLHSKFSNNDVFQSSSNIFFELT